MAITDPTDIANCEIWLDASDISSLWQDTGKSLAVTADGQTVANWEDKSTNGNDFTADTAAKEPTYKEDIYNGLSTLRFDGTSDYLISGAIAALATSTLTWFLVIKTDALGSTRVPLRSKYSSGAGASSTNLWGTFISATNRRFYNYSRAAAGTLVGSYAPLATNLTISTGRWNSDDSIESWRYGSWGEQTPTTATAVPVGHIHTTVGGDSNALGTLLWDGDIAEVIIYTSDLSDANRLDVERYLCAKWGVLHMDTTSIVSKYSGTGPADDHYARSSTIDNNGTWVHIYRSADGHAYDAGATIHIRFSEDAGDTWTAEDTFIDSGAVTGFPISPHSTYAVADAIIILADNGDLVVLVGELNSSGYPIGTWLYTSSDDGDTWSSDGQINTDSELYICSGDHVIVSGDIYVAGWKDVSSDGQPHKSVLYKSTNNGASWSSVSDITSTGEGTNEAAIAHLGGNDLITLLRDDSQAATYKRESDDLGATWGSLVDIIDEVPFLQRPKLRTFAAFPGYLFAIGRIRPASLINYMALFYTIDNAATWIGPYYPDVTRFEDSGYYDMMLNESGIYAFNYAGTQVDADIYEYKITLSPKGVVRIMYLIDTGRSVLAPRSRL